ncbi:MAG: ExbD/TolR family protein [Phycisphaerae bacterium]
MRLRLQQDEEEVAVQMAPLIDCVFLLLVFFLVASTLRQAHKEIPLTLPESGSAVKAKVEPDTIVISIDSNGEFWYNGDKVYKEVLVRRLRAEGDRINPPRVRIDAHRGVTTQVLAWVLDECQFSNLKEVGIRTRN